MHSFLKILKTFFVLLFLSFTFYKTVSADNAGSPQSKVYGTGSAIAAWLTTDSNGITSIMGRTGSVSSDPSTWITTNLTSSLSYLAISQTPQLFSNTRGDVVVIWEYLNLNSNFMVAAAMLPSQSSNWNVQVISNVSTNSQNMDSLVSISENGDVIAIWTAIDFNSGETVVLYSTTTISSSPLWTSPQIASAL